MKLSPRDFSCGPASRSSFFGFLCPVLWAQVQLGKVGDCTPLVPDVFVTSARADSGRALFTLVREYMLGKVATGQIRRVGLEAPTAVRLALESSLLHEVRERLTSEWP